MLVTERLRLDPLRPSDAPEFLALFRDPEVRRYLLDDKLIEPPWVVQEIEGSLERFAGGGVGLFAARLRGGDGALAGVAGLRPYHADELQILYAVNPALAGRGLASEMVAGVLDYCFDVAGLDTVRATVDAPNSASIRLVEKLGFRLVGRQPTARFELLVFDVGAETWRRREE